jgi:hypothetical protein
LDFGFWVDPERSVLARMAAFRHLPLKILKITRIS